jgi:hypothetical protein
MQLQLRINVNQLCILAVAFGGVTIHIGSYVGNRYALDKCNAEA